MPGALTCLLLFQLVGEIAVRWMKLPLPGPVLGMVLLFAALLIRGGIPDNLRVTGSTLLQHLMLLMVPVTVGIVIHINRVSEEWLPILLAGIGGAAVTLAVTALTLRLLLARRKKALS